jgi:hypothetical protein
MYSELKLIEAAAAKRGTSIAEFRKHVQLIEIRTKHSAQLGKRVQFSIVSPRGRTKRVAGERNSLRIFTVQKSTPLHKRWRSMAQREYAVCFVNTIRRLRHRDF